MTLLNEKQQKLVEHLAVAFMELGLQPAASRIAALLMVSDKLELTFDEIRETLRLSKSAASNGINSLLDRDRIRYIKPLGDRKRYFYSNVASWQTSLIEQFMNLKTFGELLGEIAENRTKETPEFNQTLEGISGFVVFALNEIAAIYEKWNSINPQKEDEK